LLLLIHPAPVTGQPHLAKELLEEDSGRSKSRPVPAQRRHELVFIDAGVPDQQLLLEDLKYRQEDGRFIEVVILHGSRDGIKQVKEALASRDQLDAIHFISHGTDGAVQLGPTVDYHIILTEFIICTLTGSR
jgi:hypothetical protein